MPDEADETERMWLVERTYSDDEQNVVILVYATEDGRRYHRTNDRTTVRRGSVPFGIRDA